MNVEYLQTGLILGDISPTIHICCCIIFREPLNHNLLFHYILYIVSSLRKKYSELLSTQKSVMSSLYTFACVMDIYFIILDLCSIFLMSELWFGHKCCMPVSNKTSMLQRRNSLLKRHGSLNFWVCKCILRFCRFQWAIFHNNWNIYRNKNSPIRKTFLSKYFRLHYFLSAHGM